MIQRRLAPVRRAGPWSLVAIGVMSLAACGGGGAGSSEASNVSASGHESAQAVAAGPAIVVRARASLSNNVGANMELRVDGTLIGAVEVRATAYQDYAFDAGTVAAGAKVDVVFTNDANINGADRNLYVESITINGVTTLAQASGVTLDRGTGAAAFDGKDVIPGQPNVVWNGALRFTAPGSVAAAPSSQEAFRLADQASFGATEALVAEIRAKGAAAWITAQMALSNSRYSLGNGDAISKNTSSVEFCNQPAYAGANCWRDWYSTQPLAWDFYRNATQQPDQLRQRVAFALQQIVVVNNLEVSGTYGFRNYYNNLLANAFGNYRQVLKKVALSPVMGDFLNNANNLAAAPNENFGRELLQLFSIGTCELNPDGSLKGGACTATYANETVRNYAYALTGWTYPAGGATPWGCWPKGANCPYYGGDMVPVASFHDTASRALLSGITVPAGSSAPQALELVLDSLLAHPNIAPFVGKQLIQQLVTSNPSPAYVQRVSAAFNSGRYVAGSNSFGAGQRGDLAATVAAVLLDAEARTVSSSRSAGKLREPILMFTAALRALNGRSDGEALTWWWGETLREHVFRPPSVFNFYPPDYPVPGTALVGPAFGLHNANAALARLNYLTYLLYWGGTTANASVPGAFGTVVNTLPFEADAADAAKLVDRFSLLASGAPLPAAARTEIIDAVAAYTSQNSSTWKTERVRQAAYLVFATPAFQVQR